MAWSGTPSDLIPYSIIGTHKDWLFYINVTTHCYAAPLNPCPYVDSPAGMRARPGRSSSPHPSPPDSHTLTLTHTHTRNFKFAYPYPYRRAIKHFPRVESGSVCSLGGRQPAGQTPSRQLPRVNRPCLQCIAGMPTSRRACNVCTSTSVLPTSTKVSELSKS